MSKYYLKDHVTDEMLQAVGFVKACEYPIRTYIRSTGVYCDIQKENETLYVALEEDYPDYREISFNGDWLDLNIEDYIQDLLDLNYVEVRNG